MSDSEPLKTTKVELEEMSVEVANERKKEGNDHFRAGKWNEALVAYRAALNCLPKRQTKAEGSGSSRPLNEGPPADGLEDEDGTTPSSQEDQKAGETEDVVEVSRPAVDEADKETRQLRSVLNANIGACYVKLGDHKEAVEACTQALLDDPTYVKAMERRAGSNDLLNTWSSLTSAQEDYNKLLTLVTSSSQQADFRRKLQSLKPRLEVAQKKETDEMMSKLKGLGNSLLGNFGLSTDNFQFVPNGQGGYSMNFNR